MTRWDHPRTRGVYERCTPAISATSGSSPHTRGLLGALDQQAQGPRIIPAHAGFTPWTPPPSRAGSDHPRTRGVYAVAATAWGWGTGSSPHTRGLPQDPARQQAGRLDHPRTRGVYSWPRHTGRGRRGSSPHTRGLPAAMTLAGAYWGIIPAHAGFTPGHVTRAGAGADHPRTRGVYG